MTRLYVIVTIISAAFTIYAFIDCIIADDARVRGLPKFLWAIITIIFPPFGGILWFALGKEHIQKSRPQQVANPGFRAPDDDPAFLQRIADDKAREERIKSLEARLAELDDDSNPKE